MKTLLAFVTGLLVQLSCTGQKQDSCLLKQYLILKKVIQKSIPDNERDYSNKLSEFFIIEINLNERQDSITSIDFFRKGKSLYYRFIEKAIKKVKEIWKPTSCGITRIIVPVFIYFQDDKTKLNDYPIDMRINKKTYNEPGRATYIFDVINIFVWGTIK